MQIILGFLFLLVFFYLLRNSFQSSKANYKRWLTKVTVILAGGILLLLVLTGRLHVLAALGAGLLMLFRQLPLIFKALPVLQTIFGQAAAHRAGQAGKAAAGQQSTLDTSLLAMTLDHDTGEIDGVVNAGGLKGQRLSEMGTDELRDLYQQAVAHHTDSVEVLETYLERVYGEQWYQKFGMTSSADKPSPGGEELSVDEACDILGVRPEASEQEIIAAHRKMMQKFHPDRGGSNYLAAKVNTAKEVLLSRVKVS